MSIISASSLVRNCRYAKMLDAKRDKPESVQQAADEGTRADKLIQDWLEGREPAEPEAADEPWHWYQNMRATWTPPAAIRCQVPLGLDHDGRHVEVDEPEPHVYVPRDGNKVLLTAGRADLAWARWTPDGGVRAVVGDLKRSAWRYGDPAEHPQLMALGLSWASLLSVSRLQLGLYDLRDGFWEWSPVIDLEEEGTRMLEEIRGMATMDDSPRPGPWCGGCWERRNCKHAAPDETPTYDDRQNF